MNHDLPPSYENIFGDNVQPPKYNEISRQVLTNEATSTRGKVSREFHIYSHGMLDLAYIGTTNLKF